MNVIVVGQSKGGVGKTTIAVNLAGEIARYGRSVTVIDADPQESAAEWAEPHKLPFRIRAEPLGDGRDLIWVRDVLKTPSDFVVVDLPAGLGRVFETAVLVADLLVVPCGASSIDIGAARRTIVKAREVRRSDSAAPLKTVTVATRVDLATDEGAQIADALSDLGEPVAPPLSFDVQHPRAFAEGLAVSGMAEGAHAAEEVGRLSLFLLKQIVPRQTFRAR